jgi:hypothetical protein
MWWLFFNRFKFIKNRFPSSQLYGTSALSGVSVSIIHLRYKSLINKKFKSKLNSSMKRREAW